MTRILFITGTDTGVGKTVLAALLARYLQRRGVAVTALKPISSGSRSDARELRMALEGALSLDEINPWNFPAPLAPLLAARRESKQVTLREVLAHVRNVRLGNRFLPRVRTSRFSGPNYRDQRRYEVVLIEGAGGLLSPLGKGFAARDLIARLRATPILVAPNRLGVVNQVLLTLEALPRRTARNARVVLMSPRRPDPASRTNPNLLAELIGQKRVLVFPWLRIKREIVEAEREPQVRRALRSLARRLGL